MDKSGQLVSSEECEKLRSALVTAQESAAVQLLLECCLPRNEAERVSHFIGFVNARLMYSRISLSFFYQLTTVMFLLPVNGLS